MTQTVLPPPAASGPQRALTLVGLLAVAVSALVGGNVLGTRERLWGSETPTARAVAGSRTAGGGDGDVATPTTAAAGSGQTILRSQP